MGRWTPARRPPGSRTRATQPAIATAAARPGAIDVKRLPALVRDPAGVAISRPDGRRAGRVLAADHRLDQPEVAG